MRVFGENWKEKWDTITTGQIRKFGINTIGNWNTYQGYKIKMTEPQCFTVTGEMPEDKSILVNTGANYIPVLCEPI